MPAQIFEKWVGNKKDCCAFCGELASQYLQKALVNVVLPKELMPKKTEIYESVSLKINGLIDKLKIYQPNPNHNLYGFKNILHQTVRYLDVVSKGQTFDLIAVENINKTVKEYTLVLIKDRKGNFKEYQENSEDLVTKLQEADGLGSIAQATQDLGFSINGASLKRLKKEINRNVALITVTQENRNQMSLNTPILTGET